MNRALYFLQNVRRWRVGVAAIAVLLGCVTFLAAPAAFAQTAEQDVCSGVGVASGTGSCASSPGPSVDTLVRTAVNIISVIAGVTAVIVMIVAGLRYITSGGDSSKTASAKSTIVYCLVGIIVVAFAQFLVQFVFHKATT